MLDIMYYLTHYSDALHHPKEDLVFARIKARDAGAGPVVDALTTQHAQLRDLGVAIVQTLDDVVNGSIVSREHIDARVRAYLAALRAHIQTEEREILPLAARLISDDDWIEIDAAIANFDDPLFGAHVHDRYNGLRDHINRGAQSARAASP